MLRQYRFLLISSIVSLSALLIFLGLAATQPVSASMQPTAVATQPTPPDGDAARGKYLVQIAGCGGCHGAFKLASDKGVPLAGGNEFKTPLGTFYAPNLTVLQDWDFDSFDKAIRQGVDVYSGRVLAPVMPYRMFHGLSDFDVASIGAYLRSLTEVKNDIGTSKPEAGLNALKPLPAQSIPAPKINDSADYGRYLIDNLAGCGGCHNPRDASGAVVAGREFSGGTRNLGSADNPIYAPSIEGAALIANGYTKENFAATLRLGIRPRGAPLAPQMPWRRFSGMTDNDLNALWNYLQTKKMDNPWPIQTAAPTAARTQAATVSTTAATAAPTKAATPAATAAK